MHTYAAGSSFRTLLLLGGLAAITVAGSARAQPAASAATAATARNDSLRSGDQRLIQPLQRIMDLDSALAMSALPRLHLDATRDLARATVINHRATGDSLRAGQWPRRGVGQSGTQYKSGLEEQARRLLRLTHANADLSYVTSAIGLQQAALRIIDDQLTSALQSEPVRLHIASARLYTLERLKYAEELRRELSGERTTGR